MKDHNAIITERKQHFGSKLAILGHHYQTDDVIRHTDLRGDSLELARKISGLEADYVVFCGVYFMAESAAIVSRPEQKIHIPDVSAGCTMSNMAPSALVEAVLNKLTAKGRKIIPLTYVNSSAGVKAVCGKFGGTVCTSANAEKMLKWAMAQGDGVLFLPDKNLAQNTAVTLGIPAEKQHILDIRGGGAMVDLDKAAHADLVIWPGLCSIHHKFSMGHINAVRQQNPDAKIVIHPESKPEVVTASDSAGSTSHIIKYVADAPEDATIYIGTETSLVNRLKNEYAGRKTILPLAESYCLNMGKVTESKLAGLLQNLEATPSVKVSSAVKEPAGLALQRMLDVCS
ncbi:MAG: quinolinate synthase NadA [Desulfovibrio sp.]